MQATAQGSTKTWYDHYNEGRFPVGQSVKGYCPNSNAYFDDGIVRQTGQRIWVHSPTLGHMEFDSRITMQSDLLRRA
jgi:hypothetical protein